MKRYGIALLLLLSACVYDLRPRAIKSFGDQPEAAAEARGRAILQAAAEAHGLDAWRTLEHIELDAVDTWNVAMFRTMMTPMPERTTPYTFSFQVESGFKGEGRLTGGKHAGDRFGVNGRPHEDSYVIKGGKRKRLGGLPAKIYAPSVQYFAEFPFRILEAEHVAYVDQVDWQGRPHDRVLATWGGLKPHMADDQYLLYVDAETGFITATRYTVRVAGPPMASTIVFEDLRPVDGMTLPFLQRVGFFRNDGIRELHRLEVSDIRTTASDQRQATR